MTTWEASLLDWQAKGLDGEQVAPSQVLKLSLAKTKEEATKAYWKLDGLVCSNGLVFTIALSVVKTLLVMLPSCSFAAKVRCLELLGQIAAGASAPDSPAVVDACLAELKNFYWYFIHGLQFDSVENVWLYVDIVGVLGDRFEDIKPSIMMYLQQVLLRDIPENDIEMIQNTLFDLQSN